MPESLKFPAGIRVIQRTPDGKAHSTDFITAVEVIPNPWTEPELSSSTPISLDTSVPPPVSVESSGKTETAPTESETKTTREPKPPVKSESSKKS